MLEIISDGGRQVTRVVSLLQLTERSQNYLLAIKQPGEAIGSGMVMEIHGYNRP